MTTFGMRLLRRLSAPLTALLLLAPVALGVAALARLGVTPAVLTPPPQPVYGEVSERFFDNQQDGFLELAFGEPVELVSSGSTGRITAVAVGAGDRIRSNDVLYEVDGRAIIAHHSPKPFYRDLSSGSRGDDVEALHALLQDWGLLGPDQNSATFGPQMRTAVVELNTQLGSPVRDATFHASTVVWLPIEDLIVAQVSIRPGGFSAAAGERLLTGVRSDTSVALFGADGDPVEAANATKVDALDGRSIGQTSNGALDRATAAEVIHLVVTGELVSAAQPSSASGTGTDEQAADAGLAETVRVPVVMRDAVPQRRLTVPVGSVIEDRDGRQCLFAGEAWTSFETTVSDGGIGYVVVSDAPPPGELVLANPIAIGLTSCSS